jgi:hypothetical protein
MNHLPHRTLLRALVTSGLAALVALTGAAGCGGGGGSGGGGDDTGDDAAPGDAAGPDGACTTRTYYRDSDGDGFGDSAQAMDACTPPSGFVITGGDCLDTDAAVHPGAVEICDLIDNNCNGLVDMADPAIDLTMMQSYYRDVDQDTYGAGDAVVACGPPSGFVARAGDCNDDNAAAHPGATELCDGADNDCDGGIDGTTASPNQCAALVGTYTGSYTHHTDERLGSTIINQMNCTGTGSASLVLNRSPALQGTFTCVYPGSLGGFNHNQSVTLSASVGLDGAVTGTIHHVYDSFGADRTFNVTGTQTGTSLSLSGTGSWFPNPMSVVPWGVTFSFTTTR